MTNKKVLNKACSNQSIYAAFSNPPNQRRELFRLNQLELCHKEVEVFEACVKKALLCELNSTEGNYNVITTNCCAHLDDVLEVMVVDVHKHSEQPAKYLLHCRLKCLRERRFWMHILVIHHNLCHTTDQAMVGTATRR